MIKVFYFSGSGKSRRFAEYLGESLSSSVFDITKLFSADDYFAETAVVVFPVYCQNLPKPIIDFLPLLKAEKIAFAALYGRKSYGNVIEDAVKLSDSEFIGGICVPCGHSFLGEEDGFDFCKISPFIQRLLSPSSAKTEKGKKVFYADLIPAERTRIGVKIIRSDKCSHCGKCIENCPVGAMTEKNIGKNCIRCMRCVNECPEKALHYKTLWFMKLYLKNNRKDELKFYL